MQPYQPYQRPLPRPPKKYPVPHAVIVLATVTIVLILACVVGAIINAVRPPRAIALPTATFAPVATANPAIFAPTLGGTIADFEQRYGLSNDSHGLQYVATIAGQRVAITLTLADGSQTLDGQPHIAIITLQASSPDGWSQQTADQIVQTFLPTDAQFQRLVRTGKIHDHIYLSNALAQTFTADQFTNDAGTRAVPTGTLSYSCQPSASSASGLGFCLLSIGSYSA